MLSKEIREEMIDMMEYHYVGVGGFESFSDDTLIEVFDNVMCDGQIIDKAWPPTSDASWTNTHMWKRYKKINEHLTEYILLVKR